MSAQHKKKFILQAKLLNEVAALQCCVIKFGLKNSPKIRID